MPSVKARFSAAWSGFFKPEAKAEFSGPYLLPTGGTSSALSGLFSSTFPYESALNVVYQQNVAAYKCVNLIATAIGSLSLYVMDERAKEIEKHPVLDLLAHPNPLQGQGAFIGQLAGTKVLAGVCYAEGVNVRSKAPELWSCRPDKVTVNQAVSRLPTSYVYNGGGFGDGPSKAFPVNPLDGSCELFVSRSLNLNASLTQFLSPARAAWLSVNSHNTALKWNNAMLSNGARPSGAFSQPRVEGLPELDSIAVESLKAQIATIYGGAENAGKPLVLPGGLVFQEMSLSPKDMDWTQAINVATRHICMAFGVPTQLVGLAESQTFANYEQARLAFYQDTVLPLAGELLSDFNAWLQQFYPGVRLCVDEDAIPALSPLRKEKFEAIKSSDFLTVNEKREALGWEPVAGGDVVLVPAAMLPLGESIADSETTKPARV